ncbi:E3 SUMO-protein ligase ZBED1-like isoform X2 [Neoarius graeffei]|uniref:E3 SUMO-protein ligase ZBED1-like isoform X2 n=1 Tax=Neoarius graeffei TaxID=443677 RepID=UPI00298D321B|nr:E3 SUMO-protein ligase ZBED1-like isoform X2 [Neoarius graeffei]XP_060761952.1 E3 SUMO-protein ligase ZBED1-like isoform X2 [Neoarius graeffei]XP_060761953.1 E3 SUMO-protein ligase ZBED1-like isoform X2 [Neoarius graeffei]
MKRSKRSAVWNHFKLVDSGKEAKCSLCNAVFKYNSSTTSLSYHLNNVHAAVLQGASAPDQPTITAALGRRACDDRRMEGITERICSMIERDLMPLSTVASAGFQELIRFLEPGYNIPSRGTVTSRLEARYKKKKSELKTMLTTATVALTTDCWTALTTESYITVTCHYIDENWQLKSAVLIMTNMSDRHTADNLADKLNDVVETWGLSGRVTACVHDNARNIVQANNPTRVSWKSVACFAHTLNLAVNDGFTAAGVSRAIVAAGRSVKHFHHSTVATKALEEKQHQMRLPPHRLIQSCKTRWNSVCDMFKRLVEQRWVVCAVLSDRSVTKLTDARTLELRDDYWQLMEDMGPVLGALKCATTVMSTESEVSISNTYPIAFSLINKHLNVADGDSQKVAEFKSKVQDSLGERMKVESDDLTSTPMIATMLDPRHKHLGFLRPASRISAHSKLLALASAEHESSTPAGAATARDEGSTDVQEAAHQGHRPTSAMSLLLGDTYSRRNET